jgi:hypothetical protein
MAQQTSGPNPNKNQRNMILNYFHSECGPHRLMVHGLSFRQYISKRIHIFHSIPYIPFSLSLHFSYISISISIPIFISLAIYIFLTISISLETKLILKEAAHRTIGRSFPLL